MRLYRITIVCIERKLTPTAELGGSTVAFCWFQISIALQCLSTDFSSQKGVKVRVHLERQTLLCGQKVVGAVI